MQESQLRPCVSSASRRYPRHDFNRPVILIVDDDPPFRRLMHAFLSSEQFVPMICSDPETSGQMARQHRPDLILLDLRLPTVDDGRRVLANLRDDPVTSGIPVVVVSADTCALGAHWAELRQRGAIMMRKPFDLDDMLATIYLTLDRTCGCAVGATSPVNTTRVRLVERLTSTRCGGGANGRRHGHT